MPEDETPKEYVVRVREENRAAAQKTADKITEALKKADDDKKKGNQ
jgi:hypothetical protein